MVPGAEGSKGPRLFRYCGAFSLDSWAAGVALLGPEAEGEKGGRGP